MIDVVWYNQSRGNWDSGLLCSIFEKHPETFIQHNSKQNIYSPRAIVIVTGCPEITTLRNYLQGIASGIVILTSEEDSYFDWQAAIPPHLEIWTQYYSHNKAGIKERILLGAPNRIKDYKINRHLPKKYLWSFVGQVQNPFRQACIEILKDLPDGYLRIAELFGGHGANGMEYQEYLDVLCQSQYVICPAGSMCVDSFRLYEAMECGAVPITDTRAPRDPEDFNYWRTVNPAGEPLALTDWRSLPTFLRMKANPELENAWWLKYKLKLENKLLYAANNH